MRLLIIIFASALGFCGCSNNGHLEKEKSQGPKAQEKISQITIPSLRFFLDSTEIVLRDGKLLIFWKNFKDALLRNDLGKLKTLSANCIACGICGEDAFIPVDMFFERYFPQIFSSNLLNRMNDSTKVDGHYDDGNWHIYSEECLF